MQKRDFSQRRTFPGTNNNEFDIILRVMERIQRLPTPVLFIIFLLLASLASLFQWQSTLLLGLFMLGDWLLLSLLPRLGKSFGPVKPTALALAVARTLVALLANLVPGIFGPLLQMIGTLLVFYSFLIEPQRLTLTRQTLKSPKLRAGAPIKILHLGDLHVERLTGRERRLVELTKSLKPDLILFSGDFLNLSYLRDPGAQAACRWVLQQVAAPLGVFVVTGSPAVDLDEMVPGLLAGLPLRWLRDEKVTLDQNGQRFDVVGLACTHKPFVDGPKLSVILKQDPAGFTNPGGLQRFTILLYHSPDLAPEAAEAGIDLQLSGHTHGGQVRLPFYGAIFTASLYGKALEVGRRQVGALILYVTRGLGMEGAGAPRVRFLCPPEMILWEIDGEAAAVNSVA